MQLKKIFYFYLLLVPIFISQSTIILKSMEDSTDMVLSYQFGTAGESPIPTPQSLKNEIQKVLSEHKNEILALKADLQIELNPNEKTNSLLALLLILKHEITWGLDKYLRVLINNTTKFKDFFSDDDLKKILYKLLTHAADINRAEISNYIIQTYKSIFKTSIFEKHEVKNNKLVDMLLIHGNRQILKNFTQHEILNTTNNLCKLRTIAKESQLPEIEKILSRKIWANRTPYIVNILIFGAFIIILSYLAETIS